MIFNLFKKKEEKEIVLVWNDYEKMLTTFSKNGEYVFEHFTGHIKLYGDECEVVDATFVYHIGNMNYLKGMKPVRGYDVKVNRISKFKGIVQDGVLRCDCFSNSIMNNGKVICNISDNNIVNSGELVCNEWKRGIFNSGVLKCDKWKCGTFNNGHIAGVKWYNGHFMNGTFEGEWYGGKWKKGKFIGESFVGNGTFDDIETI